MHFEEAVSKISDKFQFHLLSVWLIYIFQNTLAIEAKRNNLLIVTPLWLDFWNAFLPHYDLDTKADHLIKWPADFFQLMKSIS